MTDLLTFGETMLRLSPPGDERVERARRFEVYAAGAESNVAVAASRLGAAATWLSKLPDSPPGRRVVAELRSHGVEPAVTWGEGRQGLYYLERGAEPRGATAVYDRADAAVTTLSPAEVPTDLVRAASAVHTTGITPALSATLAETTAWLLEAAREAGATTSLDLNYRSKLWSPDAARETLRGLFPLVDVLVVAERDARAVLDRDGTPEAIARDLADEHGFETTVVTRGADGALARHGGETHRQPAFEVETVAPVGTGDAFVGGFLARRLDGDPVPAALEYAAATAALKRTIPGDLAVVTPAEVRALLDGDDRAISR